ncbi:uncharacterized protein LOC121764375 [Salvia splendens]|uniref:uncharacterized protein LOC121764375 n=1 Tax=Salvia splendens TaxID=180675 RepID=UPI001C27AE83|nr:uncharacterized protein LOC121764375 [Salvia splendens]
MASGSGGVDGSGAGSGGWDSEASRQIWEQIRAYTSAEINRMMRTVLQQQQQQSAIPRPIQHQVVVPRDHIAAYQRLFEDYFSEQSRFGDNFFRRRFRMHRDLFMLIVNALERRYKYFRFRRDASGRPRHTPIQKCTAAIRQLAYGGETDMFDEYLYIGETTARECLQYFCQAVIQIFGETYLRKPTPQDCWELMDMHVMVHEFPGMLDNIDCMHWEWKNCPIAWKGHYTTGFKGKNQKIFLEACCQESEEILAKIDDVEIYMPFKA